MKSNEEMGRLLVKYRGWQWLTGMRCINGLEPDDTSAIVIDDQGTVLWVDEKGEAHKTPITEEDIPDLNDCATLRILESTTARRWDLSVGDLCSFQTRGGLWGVGAQVIWARLDSALAWARPDGRSRAFVEWMIGDRVLVNQERKELLKMRCQIQQASENRKLRATPVLRLVVVAPSYPTRAGAVVEAWALSWALAPGDGR